MGVPGRCLNRCPDCIGKKCNKRRTRLPSTKTAFYMGDGPGIPFYVIAKDEVGVVRYDSVLINEKPLDMGVVNVDDWLPSDGRLVKIGGLGFRRV